MSGSRKKNRIRRFLGWNLRVTLKLLIIIMLLTIVEVAVLRYINPPFTVAMAGGWLMEKAFSKPYNRPEYHWRSLKDISPWLIKSVLAGEDQRFLSHHGFDFNEINQAVKSILKGGKVRGASTITMQVARTVFLWPDRTLARKALEAYYTVLIEIFLSKIRILEIYLNVVDWGNGVIGAEAASQKYFQMSSADITPSQAALMAAILPSPHRLSPVTPSEYVRERQKRIMKDMREMHL